MDSYDIKCRNIDEELRSVWPEWHVSSHLGGGAFGDVFRIYKDNSGIRMESALKVIQVSNEMTTAVLPFNEQTERQSAHPDVLSNEIQILETLRGAPNIVAMEDFFLKKEGSSSTLFVRMELLTSLQEVLKGQYGHRILSSIREIHKLGMDICRALIYCEKKGIVHRDIKPANLFVDKFGDYKVGDFGASKRMDAVYAAQTMTSIGTISYMAPEIFQGHAYNNTVDIYALGLVLYQLLNNGRMPFLPAEGSYTAQDIDRANYKRMQGAPVPSLAGQYVGGEIIDSRLDAVVRKACAVNPSDRFQTAREFYDALTISEKTEKPKADSGKKQQNSLKPARSVQNHQKERPSVGIKLLLVIVPLFIIVVSLIAVMKIRGGSAGSSPGTSTSVAAQTEKEEDGVLEETEAVSETNSDTETKGQTEKEKEDSEGTAVVNETNSDAETEDTVDISDIEMADASEDKSVKVTTLEDGTYTAIFSTDSSVFCVNEANEGKGILTVKDGKMTIHVSLASKSIVNLFPGTVEEAQKEGAALLEPTIDKVTYDDGVTEEVYGFDIPIPAIDVEFDCAFVGIKGKWYGHKAKVLNPVMLLDKSE